MKTVERRCTGTWIHGSLSVPHSSFILPPSSFLCCVEHGDDVFRRHVGEDVVDLLENETPAPLEDRDLLAGVAADLLRGAAGKDVVGGAASAPEGQPVAEAFFQGPGVHASTGD